MTARRVIIVAAVVAVCGLLSLSLPGLASANAPPSEPGWVLSPRAAARLIKEEDALVLDVRSKRDFEREHIAGAQRALWKSFSGSKPAERGLLLPARVIQAKLRALGVSQGSQVVVVGDARAGWGEDGRIVWMLRAMGHERAALVDGGYGALSKLELPRATGKHARPKPGDFRAAPTDRYTASLEQMKAQLTREGGAAMLDVREAREFKGQTPYGEARGGHYPGAVHLYYKDLMRPDGTLLEREAIEAKLAALHITSKDQPIIAYCTGGVRSAWLVVMLQQLGYTQARNYAGSMWEWSSDPERPLK